MTPRLRSFGRIAALGIGLAAWSPVLRAAPAGRAVAPPGAEQSHWNHMLTQLTHANPIQRQEALGRLSKMSRNKGEIDDPRLVRVLLKFLADPSWRIRIHAIEILAPMENAEVEACLIPLVQDPEPSVRRAALEGLARYSPLPLAAFTLAAADKNFSVRQEALTIMNQNRTPEMIPTFAKALQDPMDGPRALGIEGLLHLGAPGLKHLQDVLKGSDERGVRLLANYLRSSTDPASFSLLIIAASSSKTFLRELAASQLGHHRDPQALLQLNALTRDPVPSVRLAALRNLGDTGVPEALAVLTLAIHDPDPATQMAAVQGLAQLKVKEAAGPLIGLLSDPSVPIAQEAVQGLKALGGAPAAAALERAYPQSAFRVRPGILSALAAMDQHGIQALCRLLQQTPGAEVSNILRALQDAVLPTQGNLDDPTQAQLTDALAPLFTASLTGGDYQTVINLLSQGGPSAIPLLGREIATTNGLTRWAVIQALINAKQIEAVPWLVSALDLVDREGVQRGSIQAAIQRFGASAWPAARSLLKHPNADLRQTAVAWAGQWKISEEVDALIRLLETDPVALVKIQAAQSLGLLLDVRAIPALRRAKNDSNPLLRDKAEQALRDIGNVENDPFQQRQP